MYADSMFNSEDYRPDPTFDPVKVFNEGGHTEEEMPVISKMDNWMRYNTYKAYKDWQDDAELRISQSGATGQVVNFLGNIATDPTIYAGFGAAKCFPLVWLGIRLWLYLALLVALLQRHWSKRLTLLNAEAWPNP